MKTQKVSRRLGNRKTTTGCITCKIRRVKCGEELPNCLRCTRTGRQCDGYKHLTTSHISQALPLTASAALADCKLLVNTELGSHESRILRFFTDHAAIEIAGWVNVDFWTRLVPQLSQSQRAIRHAAMAIVSLLEQSQSTAVLQTPDALTSTCPGTWHTFALQQYGKAIQATLATIKEGGTGKEVAAVTCILFICIEALQGHEAEAISLFHRGRATLPRTTQDVEEPTAPHKTSTSEQATIDAVFGNVALQFKMFDRTPADRAKMEHIALHAPIPTGFLPFVSLVDARNVLMRLLAFAQSIASFDDLKWNVNDLGNRPKLEVLLDRQLDIHIALQQWHTEFQDLLCRYRSKAEFSHPEQRDVSMLVQQYNIVQIWLVGSLETTECCYDKYMPQFIAILRETATAIAMSQKSQIGRSFSFEMGMIPSLYLTAIKCRHPVLRRQALSLLARGPTQEGLWDSRIIIKIARRVIQLEEEASENDLVFEHVSQGVKENALPPEEKRVKFVRVYLRTTVDGREGSYIDIFTLPQGAKGQWHTQREFIALLD